MMNIEQIREFCLSLPMTSEDMAFGEDYLLMRVCDRIFACYGFSRPDYFVVKCDPDYAIDLRDRYDEIEPAWHWNKKYWNQLNVRHMSDQLIKSMIIHSYCEVVRKLQKKFKIMHPEITLIEDSRI